MEENRSEESLPIEEFLISNYQLFTVISVFAALTAYLTQLPSAGLSGRYGIGGSLLMFFVSGVVGLKKVWNQMDEVDDIFSIRRFLRKVGYATFVAGFFGILVTLLKLMMDEYPEGAGESFEYALVVPLIAVYLTILNQFWSYDGRNKGQYLVRLSPIIWGIVIVLMYGINLSEGNSLPLFHDNPTKELGYILAIGIFHVLGTISLSFTGYLLDQGPVHISNLVSRIYSLI